MLRTLRNAQSPVMSQTKLAKLVGVGRTTVTMWENGKSEPDNTTLVKLAEIFGVSTDCLLGYEEFPEQKKSSSPTISDEEAALNQELISHLVKLTPDEQEKVDAFVQGLLASR